MQQIGVAANFDAGSDCLTGTRIFDDQNPIAIAVRDRLTGIPRRAGAVNLGNVISFCGFVVKVRVSIDLHGLVINEISVEIAHGLAMPFRQGKAIFTFQAFGNRQIVLAADAAVNNVLSQ